MRESLVVIGDGILVEACNAECASNLQCGVRLRQLPQAAKQPAGRAPRE